jgi:cytochrome P450
MAELPVFPFETPPGLDTDPELERLRVSDPVPKVRLAPGGEAWLVTRYDDAKRVFAEPTFSRAEAVKPGVPSLRPARQNPYLLVSMDPPEHTRVRKLVAAAFTKRGVERMRPRIQATVDSLIGTMRSAGPPIDFVDAFAAPLPAFVISDLLGAPVDDHRQLRAWMDIALSVTAHTPDEVRGAGEHMAAYLTKLIATKRAAPAEDLLSALVETYDNDRLSEPELLATTYIMLVAGYETTAGLLANSIITLNRHPDQLELLRNKPELIPNAVEEILRYVPIAKASLERYATKDTTLSGVPIPAGSTLIPLQYSANRDDTLAPEPDKFDITRPPTTHLAFGHGTHYCLGAQLARLELGVAYAALLAQLPGLRPAEPESTIAWKQGMITRGPITLPVTW